MTRTARLLLAAATVTATAVVLPLAAGPVDPAEAGYVSTTFTTSSPVTWVDAQGRQLMIATSTNSELTIARDTPTGEPDTTWGPGGIKKVAFDVPDGAVSTSTFIAPDDDGILTLIHRGPGCSAGQPCDGWTQRIDGTTGATVAGPTEIEDSLGPWRALKDGSILLAVPGSQSTWMGPDGTERGTFPLTPTTTTDADVDGSGRLLVLDSAGTVTRYPAGAAADLTVATGCDQGSYNGAIGASSFAPGFAVACDTAPGSGIIATAQRYSDTGTLDWTAAGTEAGAPPGFATDVTVLAGGTVWVGTRSPISSLIAPYQGLVAATPATSAGWGARVDLRTTGGTNYSDFGGGIVQMRPIGDGTEIAIADLQVCCQYPNNRTGGMAAHSYVVPYRPGPPTCRASEPVAASPSAGALDVVFSACSVQRKPIRRPTSYRVDLTIDGATTSKTVPDTAPGSQTKASFTGVPNGVLATMDVTGVNGHGDSLAGPAQGATVTPFPSLMAFIDHQGRTLGGRRFDTDALTSYHQQVASGSLELDAFLEQVITSGGAPLESVEPTARIYRAAFLRDADIGGLRYWVAQHRSGTRIAAMAEQFARSSEFRRRYGALGNRAFVQRIYQNVLGRPGDAAGIDFWTRRLDTGRATRGAVLAGFSESGEFVRKTRGVVQPLTVTFLMLDRRPTASEKAAWSTADDVYGAMPEAILVTDEYAARVRG